MIYSNKYQAFLFAHQDKKYQAFQKKLIPNINSIIGVRTPIIHQYAKQLIKEKDNAIFQITPTYFEENLLKGLVMAHSKKEIGEVLLFLNTYLESIDNWATCDIFVNALKITKLYKEKMWNKVLDSFQSNHAYTVRFACVMCLTYYLDEHYILAVFNAFNKNKIHDYYVDMAIAWAISIYYIHFPKETENYLKTDLLNDFTHNKAIQKIRESKCINQETKEKIKQLKR